MTDYIIVGAGIAGVTFAEQARIHSKSFVVFDAGLPSASSVAGGIYNPVVLKRLRMVEKAGDYLDEMNGFFNRIERVSGEAFRVPMPIFRRISSVEEQNDWTVAAERMPRFLNPEISFADVPCVSSPYGFGIVKESGYVELASFLKFYQQRYMGRNLQHEKFDVEKLEVNDDGVIYNGHKARHIVFAEGRHLLRNPLFNDLPLQGTKGELLIMDIPGLKLDFTIKGGVFVMPLGRSLFKVGSTYNWSDTTEVPTENGKKEILAKFSEIVTAEFSIVKHLAGIRPTTKDRKPLVGTHPDFANVHILNGLGSRGVMLAPLLAKNLYEHIESGKALPSETDISRFRKI